jgi:DNA modification methylase
MRNSILIGDARVSGRKLPPKSISAIVTSPPYFNKRIYAKKVITGDESHAYPEPIVWGGDKNCQHDWKEQTKKVHNGRGDAQKSGKFSEQKPVKDTIYHYRVCIKCDAYEGELGQEKNYQSFISHLADVFDPLLIALRDDGVCFINLGDSMIDGEQANIPVLFAEEMKCRGWKLRRDIIWYKKNAMSASDPSNFTMDYEHFFFFVKKGNKKKYYFETQFKPFAESTIKEILKDNPDPNNGKYANSEVNGGMPMKHRMLTKIRFGGNKAAEYGNPTYSGNEWEPLEYGAFMRSVWDITTRGTKIKHYAAWPAELCKIPIQFGCPTHICTVCNTPRKKVFKDEKIATRPGKNVLQTDKSGSNDDPNAGFHQSDWSTKRMKIKRTVDGYEECTCQVENNKWKRGIVLDPFGGTGMTGVVASWLGCDYVIFELNPEYANFALENFKIHENKSPFRNVKTKKVKERKKVPQKEQPSQSEQLRLDCLPEVNNRTTDSTAAILECPPSAV